MSNIYVGMDMHQASITLAVLPAAAPSPTRIDQLPNDLPKLRRYLDHLAEQGSLQTCYEASGAGYVLHRALAGWGYPCAVIAPSLIPTKPGVQRKHDRYDAAQLTRLLRAGELTAVRVPSEAEERIRDLVRCRETLQRELLQSKHYLLKFLTRRGAAFREGKHWTKAHLAWLESLTETASPLVAEDQTVFREYLALFHSKNDRRLVLDRQIAVLAHDPSARPGGRPPPVLLRHPGSLGDGLGHGLGDRRRFTVPTQLMAYLGLVPTERSSGPRERKGSITKAGNSHCRHVLIQAAWSYRHRPKVAATLRARQRHQPAPVIAHAWKAQHRLHALYQHLAYRKQPRVEVVAVARELAGFLWAVMQDGAPPAAAAVA